MSLKLRYSFFMGGLDDAQKLVIPPTLRLRFLFRLFQVQSWSIIANYHCKSGFNAILACRFAEMERAARRQYDPPPAQADILFGEGRFAEAAAAYRRVASADPASGTRSGVALALAGRREEAESAFRAVSGAAPAGNLYADLARFWTAWLTRPA